MRNLILTGDVLNCLLGIPDESVQTCVTSPPYYGLRDYGHNGQIGMEKSPEDYVDKMVLVFRQVRRVLRPDGTLWLNLGDSYNAAGRNGHGSREGSKQGTVRAAMAGQDQSWPSSQSLNPKDLLMIPARVAMALQADGWWLRGDIIWAKKNPMPESVTDRPTRSHEYIFLLTKSARYFYDHVAVRRPASEAFAKDPRWGQPHNPANDKQGYDEAMAQNPKGPHRMFARTDKQRGHSRRHEGFNERWDSMPKEEQVALGANLRDVWHIATTPYPGSHFATFPPTIPELCIKAGTSERGQCSRCGKPWVRISESKKEFLSGSGKSGNVIAGKNGKVQGGGDTGDVRRGPTTTTTTTGWKAQCKCRAAVTPSIVLDPFAGSGTTLEVAKRMGRDYIGIELNEKYVHELIEPRLAGIDPLFAPKQP